VNLHILGKINISLKLTKTFVFHNIRFNNVSKDVHDQGSRTSDEEKSTKMYFTKK